MSKSLILAEKPSVGKDIARVLGCRTKNSGTYENEQYIVTWALGHLVTLADPEAYNDKYKSWHIEDLPIIPNPFKLVAIKESSRQYNLVRKLMRSSIVKEIIIATDAGREGELVARWTIEHAGVKKPLKRLWISSVTDKAIKQGFAGLRNGRDYDNLYAAAEARSEADWVVGINATRALTCKYNAQLSCGRVQTPTLAIIAKRENEISNFVPKPYYGITARTNSFNLIWQDQNTRQTRTFNQDHRDRLIASLTGNEAQVIEVKKTFRKKFAPQLYDLTELQREANRLFDFSAKETLSIIQRLYETHKLLTYPRTDSCFLSSDMTDTLKDRINACAVGPYREMSRHVLRKNINTNLSFIDDQKVSDHHAIIPTEEPASLNALSFREKNIYDLVVRRFLAVFYPPFEYEQVTVTAKLGNETFIARGKTVLINGWKEVYLTDSEDEEDDNQANDEGKNHLADQILPALNEGDQLKITSINKTSGETRAPDHFNEGTLLKAMVNPAKYMAAKDKNMINTIGKSGGLGTVATRADIIEKLFNSFLIESRGKDIYMTAKGKQLLDLVPEDLKTPDLTAEWELKLEAIAKGKLAKDSYVAEMKRYAGDLVNQIKSSDQTFKHDNLTGNRCPQCGQYMLEVKSKKGKLLICQDRECGHRDMVARTTNARCPQCRKKLELRGSGEGQIFVCPCGFREKLSAFEARKKQQGRKVSKKEVSRYMKQQKQVKDEPINTAMAEALQKLKDNN